MIENYILGTLKWSKIYINLLLSSFMTQSWETVPINRTSGKIKLTPPAYSHTTVLLISSLNFSLPTRLIVEGMNSR